MDLFPCVVAFILIPNLFYTLYLWDYSPGFMSVPTTPTRSHCLLSVSLWKFKAYVKWQ